MCARRHTHTHTHTHTLYARIEINIGIIPQLASTSSQDYSPLQPVNMDLQEGYMYMEKPDHDVSTKASTSHLQKHSMEYKLL